MTHPHSDLSCRMIRLFLCLVLLAAAPAAAKVTKKDVDEVRAKSVLMAKDLTLVSQYVSEQFADMLGAPSHAGVTQARKNLLAATRSTVTDLEAYGSYADTFVQAVKDEHQRIFTGAAPVANPDLTTSISVTAAMLAALTDHPLLLDDLLKLLEADSQGIRYWAIKGLAMPQMLQRLADAGNAEFATVTKALNACLASAGSGLIIGSIAESAAALGPRDGVAQLLRDCVAKRLRQYQDWTVTDEAEDLRIIRSLLTLVGHEDLEDEKAERSNLINSAAQLFSAAHYRYAKAVTYQDKDKGPLSLMPQGSQSRPQLQLVLIEGERLLYRTASRTPPEKYRRLVLKEKIEDFDAEHKLLFGPRGMLSEAFGIFTDPADAPKELPDPTVDFITRALNRQAARGKVVTAE